jgi:hypothetical protein
MGRLERAVVLGYLGDELPVLMHRARDLGLDPVWDEATLTVLLRLTGRSEAEGETEHYLLSGCFDDYRWLPPIWRFLDHRTAEAIGRAAYPLGGWDAGSVLHPDGLVCAPWSRDSYAARGGPHSEWQDMSAWQTVGGPMQTKALTLPDMFARLYAEVQMSPRRMAPLPNVKQAA